MDEFTAQRVDVTQQRRHHAGSVVDRVRVSFADADVLFSEQIVVVPVRGTVAELLGERQPRGTAGATLQSHVGAWRARNAPSSRRQRRFRNANWREPTSRGAVCLLRPASRPPHREHPPLRTPLKLSHGYKYTITHQSTAHSSSCVL